MKQMSLDEFRGLPQPEQIDVLYQRGVYVGKRMVGDLPAVLYQLESFYVEVIYVTYRLTIARVRSFSSLCFLDPYLDQIKIEELVS